MEYIVIYRQTQPEYDKFMRWTQIPDEMYYHTLIANGPARARIATSLTGANWVEGREHPEIITRSTLPDLLGRKVFLARKFRADDIALLTYLESLAVRTGQSKFLPHVITAQRADGKRGPIGNHLHVG